MILRTSLQRRHAAECDMTPMVDVTFLLLIFFMVTAAFQLRTSLPIPPPTVDEASRTPEDSKDSADVTVFVDDRNSYLVTTANWEREASGRIDLTRQLLAARREYPQADAPVILVQAHEEALHESVVAALDAARRSGVSELQLTTVAEQP